MSDERPDIPPVQLGRVRASFEESSRVKLETLAISGARIAQAAELLAGVFRSGGKLLAFGNGGSASDPAFREALVSLAVCGSA